MSLKNFLHPQSVALIGASADPAKLGFQILTNLKNGGFKGAIYPVNLKEKKILGLTAYPAVEVIKKKIDLALIVIPAVAVIEAVKKCAVAGIQNIIIISAGFGETDEAGAERENELKQLAVKYELNILGPNCLGLINSAAKLNLTFARSKFKTGPVAMLSQSGALGSAALDWAESQPFGFSKFISLGNKMVLDENDFFEYFLKDTETKLVVAYLENINHGERMMAAVSRLARIKPVAVLKSGRTEAGAKAALSHTGALAGSNEAVIAGLRRAGAIILDNPEELFDLLTLAQRSYKFKTGELSIISNAGGPLVLATDAAARSGLALAEFSTQTVDALRRDLPAVVRPNNPLDLIGDAPASRYQTALEVILSDEKCESLLVILTPQTVTEIETTAKAIVAAAKKYKEKLICASFIGGHSLEAAINIMIAAGVPNFSYPERAVTVMTKLIHNRLNAAKIKPYRAGKVIKLREGREQLDYLESFALLEKYDIKAVLTERVDGSPDLSRLHYPCALKVVGKKLIHKTERQAIALNLKNSVQANIALNNFQGLLKEKTNYCVSQPMVHGGLELILGFRRDASFGPIMMVGLGGIYAEIFKDVATEVDDLDGARVREMLKRLKSFPILNGARGRKFDLDALIETILKLQKLALKETEIIELDLNPLFLMADGALAADVRIIV
jgi:acetyltransferase